MFYMVNPSNPPKRAKRRNPELLIVNPYSLKEERNDMARKSRKARKGRRNPLARRRRNPDFKALGLELLGPGYKNVKTLALMLVGGGIATSVAQSVLGSRVGGATNVGKSIITLAAGLGGAVIARLVGERLPGTAGQTLSGAAVPIAMGAVLLGAWTIAQPHVNPVTDSLSAKLGLSSWGKEFDGYSPYGQAYYDEFTSGVSPGMSGLGQPVVASTEGEDNPFKGMSGYEPLGDIYGNQRLGSFEAEPGFGGFVPETSNPRDQQVADVMKNKSGAYGNYEGGSLFDPLFTSD